MQQMNNLNYHLACKHRILSVNIIETGKLFQKNGQMIKTDDVAEVTLGNGNKIRMPYHQAQACLDFYVKTRNKVIRSRPRPAVVSSSQRRKHAFALNFHRAPRTQHHRETRSNMHSDEGGGENGGSSDPDEPAPITPFCPNLQPKQEREALHVAIPPKAIFPRLEKVKNLTLSPLDGRRPL